MAVVAPEPVQLPDFASHADSLVDAKAMERGGEEYWVEGAGRHEDHVERLDWILRGLRGRGSVLEVGSGSGYITHRLRNAGVNATGVDASRRWVEWATRRYGPWYVQGLGESLAFGDGSFDGILLAEVLEHVLDPVPVLWEAKRVLRPEGVLVVTIPSSPFSVNEPDHRRYIGAPSLLTLLLSQGLAVDMDSLKSNQHFRYAEARKWQTPA